MPIPFPFDFKKPDYTQVFEWRIERLNRIRKDPSVLPGLHRFYREDPAQFITDWGMTADPRNIERNLPAVTPFLLFPKQEEWVHWVIRCWKEQRPGVSAKSRDMGLTWLATSLASTIGMFTEGVMIGFGSRKEEYVDKLGDPKCILYKVRQFVSLVPKEFRGSWDAKKHAPHMRVQFPSTNSVITGEAGDGIGRGDRASLYFVDEAAWLPRPELVEASLSATTNCRQDISTVHGMNNPFAKKFNAGKIDKFAFHWTDDPRKDQVWYDKKVLEIDDPIVVAQEIDMDFFASVEGVVIPAAWVDSAIDAHIKLGIEVSGKKVVGGDIADEGRDKNAGVVRHGILIETGEQWSGEGGDIYRTTERLFSIADMHGCPEVRYDADGLGAGVRGDARVIKETRKLRTGVECRIVFTPHHGSGAVVHPEEFVIPPPPGEPVDPVRDRKNKDYFANYKSQSWFSIRRRFQLTHRAVAEGLAYDPADIISISSAFPNLTRLKTELSQPTYSQNGAGKMLVDKAPEGSISPNMADAVVIAFAPTERQILGWMDVDI